MRIFVGLMLVLGLASVSEATGRQRIVQRRSVQRIVVAPQRIVVAPQHFVAPQTIVVPNHCAPQGFRTQSFFFVP